MASVYPAPQVVVIDDDPSILSTVCELLADANITAEACPSGLHAFKYIIHRRPRVVILDVLMPGVDGVEVFHQLRKDPFMKHVAVIFLTGDAGYLKKRFPDYVAQRALLHHKPLDGDVLIEMVSKALGITPEPPLQERSVDRPLT